MSSGTADAASGRRHAIVSVTLLIVCQSFQSLAVGGIALFLPLIRSDLSITFAQGGMLSGAATLTYGAGQIPAGLLCQKYGAKNLFAIGLAGALALSFNLARITTFEGALLNQLLSGAFRALLFSPGVVLITSWFPPNRRATAMGLFVIGGMSGNLFLSLGGPALIGPFGWRKLFMGFAVAGFVMAALFQVFGSERRDGLVRQDLSFRQAVILMTHRIMWLCGGLQFLRFGVVTAFNFWLPSFLVADRGLTIAQAGWITAMSAALTAGSNALGGYVSDRLRNPPLVIGVSIAALGCTAAILPATTSMAGLLVVVAVNAVFLQFYFGPLFHVPVEVLGVRTVGVSTGVSNVFANVGALVFALLLGIVRDKSGSFTLGFASITVTCVLGVLLTVAMARTRARALAGLRVEDET